MPANELLQQINEETNVPLSSSAPLDMHPGCLERSTRDAKPGEPRAPTIGEVLIDGGTGRGAAGYRAGRRAHAVLFSGLTQIAEAHQELLKPIQIAVSSATKKPIVEMRVPEERQAELAPRVLVGQRD